MEKKNYLTIKTPEGVAFSLLLAGPSSRFMAWLIDWLVITGCTMVLGSALKLLGIISLDMANAVSLFAYFMISFGYGILLEWRWRGQTLGKRMMRLRVVDAEGLRLRFSQVVIRNLLRSVDSLPALYLVGGISALVSKKAQRLGDIAANTIVNAIPDISKPNLERLFSDKFNSLRKYPHINARLRQNVSPRQADLALQALIRRENLDPDARVELFSRIADYFKSIVTYPPEALEGVSDEQYVRNVVDILFRTNR